MSERVLLWLSPAETPVWPDVFAQKGWEVRSLDSTSLPVEGAFGVNQPAVGVVDLSLPEQGVPAELPVWMEHYHRIPWVALLSVAPRTQSPQAQFVAEYCSDFHTLPLDPLRLEATLGHLWGMARLQERITVNEQPPLAMMQGESPAIAATTARPSWRAVQ